MDQEQIIKLHYNDVAHKYNNLNAQFIDRLISNIPECSRKSILDIGCGTGHSSFCFLKKGFPKRVVGIDISDVALQIARQRAREMGLTNFEFIAANAKALPFNSNEFDIVVSNMVFHHITAKQQALKEILRVLKKSGYAIIQCMGGGDFLPEFVDVFNRAWKKALPKTKPPKMCYPLGIVDLKKYLARLAVKNYEISLCCNTITIKNNEVSEAITFFNIVAGFWQYGLDHKTKNRIELLLKRLIEETANKKDSFSMTRNMLLIKFNKSD